MTKNSTYFVSDMHFGTDVFGSSVEREKHFVRWIESVRGNMKALYLLGDVFDFWFEYRHAVPQGFTRFLGKIAELSDEGVEVHYFTGNHDIWIYRYLPHELGVILHREPLTTNIDGKIFYLAHGDGLGDNNLSFRFIRGLFHNRACRYFFSLIHPSFGIWLALKWANHSRRKEFEHPAPYLGEEREPLVMYAKDYIRRYPEIDYLILGHRHIMLDLMLNRRSRMMIIGDWLKYFSYAVFDGEKLALEEVIR